MTERRLLSELTLTELSHQLASSGVWLRIPPFVMHIQSPIPVVAEGLHALADGIAHVESSGLRGFSMLIKVMDDKRIDIIRRI